MKLIWSFFFAVLFGIASLGYSQSATSSLDSEESAFLTLINNFRAQNGAGALQASVALENSSDWMSTDMAAKNYFSHTDSLGRAPGQRIAAFNYPYFPWGENLAAGYSDAQNTFNLLATACDADANGNCTYAHRQNMLNASFKVIGISRAYSKTSTYGWYWTTDFGGVVDQTVGTGGSPAPDTLAPTAPVASAAVGQTQINLTWTASTDNVAVTGYQISRNGSVLTTVSATTLAYSDTVVSPNTLYSYTVRAFDAASNYSIPSNTAQATTPSIPSSLQCPAPATNTFTGCYYNNIALNGSPTLVRTDNTINFSWGSGSPDKSLTPANFSARWQGYFTFVQGTFKFSAITSDGMRVYIDGVTVLDRWRDQPPYLYTFSAALTAGKHLIAVEYYEHTGGAMASLTWQNTTPVITPAPDSQAPASPVLVSAVAKSATEIDLTWLGSSDNVGVAGYQILRNGVAIRNVTASPLNFADTGVAANTIYSYSLKAFDAAGNYSAAGNSLSVKTPALATSAGFTGSYYNNTGLSGTPVLVRTDNQINFNWGFGSPDKSLTPGNFSARWQGTFAFAAGTYSFTAIASDGIRIYIDGVLILDRWRDQSAYMYVVKPVVTGGNHSVVVEYYEKSGNSIAMVSWQKN